MSKIPHEKRVEALEQEIVHLRNSVEKSPGEGWKAFVGAFSDDPYFKKAMEIGRRYRRSLGRKLR